MASETAAEILVQVNQMNHKANYLLKGRMKSEEEAMQHIALARRYRPRNLDSIVGQEVVLRALKNALESKQLHHAYLLSGKYGVGKTSLARIIAKCLNCETGISATPCGKCAPCEAIDAGRFVDLLEIDAASRTKVEDTRELLDNVQYLPTEGRFKIYLIDEVHMLSGHSFNALLKTLEEPPPHVKFLLATTDPQKLPITVLSRCLQFHLKALSFKQLISYLHFVLKSEHVDFEQKAVEIICRAAQGSARDALSLLEQTLAYGKGKLLETETREMLGLAGENEILLLLSAIFEGKIKEALNTVKEMFSHSLEATRLLSEMLNVLQQIAIGRALPEALELETDNREVLLGFATQLSSEEIQVYYQIGLMGQRDLPYYPNPEMGFEMIVLRMLSFRPVKIGGTDIAFEEKVLETPQRKVIEPRAKAVMETNTALEKKGVAETPAETPAETNETNWPALIQSLSLEGLTRALAEHCVISSWGSDTINLILDETQKPLYHKRHEDLLSEVLSQHFKRNLRVKITVGKPDRETPAIERFRAQEMQYTQAKQTLVEDFHVQELIETFDAKLEKIDNIK